MAAGPVWAVGYVPVQDLPFHAAAIRVLASFHDPSFGFDHEFVLSFGGTQYLLYHVVGAVLARLSSPLAASRILMTGYLAGTVLALRAFLGAIRQDERLALFVVPLLINVPFMTGLLPFVAGIPLLFAGLAVAIRYGEASSGGRGLAIALISVGLFYAHVSPFGLFCLGYLILWPWPGRPR